MYPPPNGDVLVASQKEKRMKEKSKTMQKKSNTKKYVEYGEQKKQCKKTTKLENTKTETKT